MGPASALEVAGTKGPPRGRSEWPGAGPSGSGVGPHAAPSAAHAVVNTQLHPISRKVARRGKTWSGLLRRNGFDCIGPGRTLVPMYAFHGARRVSRRSDVTI